MRFLNDARRFVTMVFRRFVDDGGLHLCGSLAFTTLLSVVPVVTVAFTMFSAFPAFSEFTDAVQRFVHESVLPERIARTVLDALEEFTHNAAGLTTFGVLGIAVTALVLVATIEQAFDKIWRVQRTRAPGSRLLLYWGVATLGPILVGASLSTTSYLVQQSLGFAGDMAWVGKLVLNGVPILLMAAAFSLLYGLIPSRPVHIRHALAGGIAAAILFELTKHGFALYVSAFAVNTLYGTFTAVPIFLLWIYVSWVVIIIGAEIAALAPDYTNLHLEPAEEPPGIGSFLPVLRALVLAQSSGRAASTHQLVAWSALPRAQIEPILERLVRAGWVSLAASDRWSLACDPRRVAIAEIYAAIGQQRTRPENGPEIESIRASLAELLRRPLAALGAEYPAPIPQPEVTRIYR